MLVPIPNIANTLSIPAKHIINRGFDGRKPELLLLSAAKTAPSSGDAESAAILPVLSDSALYRAHHNSQPTASPHPNQTAIELVAPLKTFLREQEQAYLNRALEHCGGDKEQAAILLGVSLATLYRKLSGEEKEV